MLLISTADLRGRQSLRALRCFAAVLSRLRVALKRLDFLTSSCPLIKQFQCSASTVSLCSHGGERRFVREGCPSWIQPLSGRAAVLRSEAHIPVRTLNFALTHIRGHHYRKLLCSTFGLLLPWITY